MYPDASAKRESLFLGCWKRSPPYISREILGDDHRTGIRNGVFKPFSPFSLSVKGGLIIAEASNHLSFNLRSKILRFIFIFLRYIFDLGIFSNTFWNSQEGRERKKENWRRLYAEFRNDRCLEPPPLLFFFTSPPAYHTRNDEDSPFYSYFESSTPSLTAAVRPHEFVSRRVSIASGNRATLSASAPLPLRVFWLKDVTFFPSIEF